MSDKIGLVLEGGGMRGMYTTAVLDVFMQEGISVDGLIGVSAGAIHGCNYISKQMGRSIKYNLKYIQDKRYVSLESLITSGDIFNAKFCYDTIPNELSVFDYDTFQENAKDIAYYVTCTNVKTGKPYYHRCMDLKDEMDYLRASASLPLVSKVIERDGLMLLDGGTADSIPIRFFEQEGYNKNIVVLTRPEGYIKKPDSTIKILEHVYKEYPEYLEACRNRHNAYNETLEYLEKKEKEGSVFIIRPSRTVKIGRLEKNKDKLKYMYRLGWYDTKKILPKLQEFIEA